MVSYHNLTRKLPEITARYFGGQNQRGRVRVVVIHTTECNEANKAAVSVAKFFANNKNETSAHIVVDED